MRLLIASDIHGALDSALFLYEKSLALKPDLCVLLGDYLYHGPRNPLPKDYTPQDVAVTLGKIAANGTKIIAVRGNCDALVDENLLPFPLSEQSSLYVDGLSIIAAHGHQFGRDPDFSAIEAGTIMLTGHIHFPVAEDREHVVWWNPGSLSLPKQGTPRAYGVYEDGVFTVYDMKDATVLRYDTKGNNNAKRTAS